MTWRRERTDVVIVGVGAAGAILAAELASAGMRVIALERGPRHVQADFKALDELRFFQRQDTRPNVKRQPVTWRPNANARATPLRVLNYGNQAGGGTVHYGAVSWRFHEDDFRARSQTVERYGAKAVPGRLLARRLAALLCRARTVLRQGRIRSRRLGQSGQSQRQHRRRRQSVRSAAQAGISTAAVARRSIGPPVRGSRQEDRLQAVRLAARHHLAGLQGPGRVHLLRFLPGLRLLQRRQVEHARHASAASRRNRQLQTDHACDGLSRQQRQFRPRDGRLVLRPRRIRQHDRGRHRDSGALRLRQHAPAAPVQDGEIPERARQFERAGGQALHGPRCRRACMPPSTTATSTITWGRTRRSTASTNSTATISTTRTLASSAARTSRSRPQGWKADRSRARWASYRRRARPPGVRPIAISSPNISRATSCCCRRRRIFPTRITPSISTPT